MLYDTYNRLHTYLRISLTDNCNLRCFYCMPDEDYEFTPTSRLMQANEIEAMAKTFVQQGVNKIRLTGGEPLVREDAADIIRRLGKLGINVTLTTNATRLHEFVDILKEANVHSLNISLDTLQSDKFNLVTRRDQFKLVYDNIHLMIKNNFHVKVNMVVMKGLNENEITDFVEWTKHEPVLAQNNKQKRSGVDTVVIEQITGIKGKANSGEYKITIPQNDLSIEVDGFKIIPAMGLGTWIAFTSSSDGVMVMGDIVLTETDLKPVQQVVIKQGLTITAIHNHFVRNHPNVMYMHIGGSGSVEAMAQKAKAVLDKVKEVRNVDPSKGTASSEGVANTLDTKKLDAILNYKAEMSKGVYKYTIGRPDVKLMEHGVAITTFMGFNTWAAFQGSPEHAAVCGDFTMLEDELADVIKALIERGIEVVAVHNHMSHEQPRIFFLHYWGVGNAEELATGLKAALDQTGKKKTGQMKM